MRLSSVRSVSSCEAGVSFIETVVALAILGIIAVTFLTGMTITSKAAFTTDEQATAESLARSQMEWAQSANYTFDATWYATAPIPSGKDYFNYSANITAALLTGHSTDDGIQKITVIVSRFDEQIITLESYKVNR